MQDKRRNKRVPFKTEISIKSLYKVGEQEPVEADADIIVTNISKSGLGFISDVDMPVDHFFNCKISIDKDHMFYCVLKILRSSKTTDGYQIGSEFVGLAELLGNYITDYAEEIEG